MNGWTNALNHNDPWQSVLGYAYAVAGRRAEAHKVLDQLNQLSKQKYVPATFVAEVYLDLGEKDKAFERLGKFYEQRAILGSFLRKKEILGRMSLEPL